MSLLHRSLIAQILAGIEPVVEGVVTALVPGGVALAPLVHLGLDAAENVADSVHDSPVAVAGTTVNSPLPEPAAPAKEPVQVLPQGSSQAQPPAPAPVVATNTAVPVALSAADVITAMMATLQQLQSKL